MEDNLMRNILFKGYIGFTLLRLYPRISRLKKITEKKEKIQFVDKMLVPVLEQVIKITGADVTVTGAENVPVNEAVLYVGNHQGNMDIPLLYLTAPQKMSFVAKKEMVKLPIFGFLMKQRQCVFMDRENVRESIKSINEAIDNLKQGFSIAIFPEGTRSKGSEMGEFKVGSLRIALKAGVKVIPVSLSGSYKLMEETGKITPAKVSIHYGKPIDSKDFKDTNGLAQKVLYEIQKHICINSTPLLQMP